MPDARLDRLAFVLRRARHRAELAREARKKVRENSAEQKLADDYVDRLAEKHLYRELLLDFRMDALRFRWYFTQIKKDTPLDELRAWIDHKIAED